MCTLILLNCKPEFNRNLLVYTTLLAITGISSNTSGTAKVVSRDFYSSDTLAPIVIAKTRSLEFTMDSEMSSSCGLSFNDTAVTSTVTLSTDKKSVRFTPLSAGWPVGVENALYIKLSDCKDKNGNAAVTDSGVQAYVADAVTYLSSTGSDSADGSSENPVVTLSKALTLASADCPGACAVAVKGGTYTVSAAQLMPLNVSLFGGFDPADWKKRRADKTSLAPYDTVISDSSVNVTGTGVNPYSTLKYSAYTGTKDKSIIDGIIVNGPLTVNAGSYAAPIGIVNLASGAGVTIRNSMMNDRSTTISVTSAGFVSANNSGSIVLINSAFNGSTVSAASSSRYGIVYSGASVASVLSLTSSTLDAGVSAMNASGFYPTGTVNGTITISKNTVSGPICTGCDSEGITANFASANGMTISENTITAGTGANSYGINHYSGTGLTLSKNIISTSTGTLSSKGYTSGGSVSLTASENKITVGTGGINGSVGIVLNSSGSHSITNNIIQSGDCTGAGCMTSGIQQILAGTSLTIDSNTISTANCTNASCTARGYDQASGVNTPTVSITNNKITLGNGGTNGSFGIMFNSNNGTNLITGNTITTGSATGNQCSGIKRTGPGASSVTISNNIISTAAACTGGVNRALDIQNIGGTTAISNNDITAGASTAASTGIELNNSSFTVSGNTVRSGGCSNASCTSIGINSGFGTPITITNNTVTAGTCSGTNCDQKGIYLAQSSATYVLTGNTVDSGIPSANTLNRIAFDLANWSNADIQRNTFTNGSGTGKPTAVQIAANTNTLRFCSNVLSGGSRTDAGNAASLSLIGALTNAKFNGNTIIGADVSSGTVDVVLFGAGAYTTLSLDQNILTGTSASAAVTTCVREAGAASYQTLAVNSFSNCSNLYNDAGTNRNFLCTSGQTGNFSSVNTSCGGGNLSSPMGLNNVNITPVFINASGNDFHLNASTPTGITQAMASADLTVFSGAGVCNNSLDRDGATRTNNSSIGAYK